MDNTRETSGMIQRAEL